MALSVPSFADPRDPAHPLAPAYGWMSFLAIDLASNTGHIVLTINTSEANWQAQPVATIGCDLGQGGFPTLGELMEDAEFADAFNTIGSKLYAAAAATHPELKGATPA